MPCTLQKYVPAGMLVRRQAAPPPTFPKSSNRRNPLIASAIGDTTFPPPGVVPTRKLYVSGGKGAPGDQVSDAELPLARELARLFGASIVGCSVLIVLRNIFESLAVITSKSPS